MGAVRRARRGLLAPLELGIESLAEPVTEQVEAEHRQHDGDAREDTQPRRRLPPTRATSMATTFVVDGGASGNLLGRLPGLSQITRS